MRRDRFTPVTSPGTRLDPVLGKGAAARAPRRGMIQDLDTLGVQLLGEQAAGDHSPFREFEPA